MVQANERRKAELAFSLSAYLPSRHACKTGALQAIIRRTRFMKKPLPLLHRFISAIGGLFVGLAVGMLGLYLIMSVVGSDFGLDNVRPGAVLGAGIGFFLGWRFPRRCSLLDLIN